MIFKYLFATSGYAGLIARLTLGVVMLPHGYEKIMAFEKSMAGLTTGAGLPAVVAFLVIIGESLGAISLIVGFLSRFCAVSIGIIMAGAMLMFHTQNGFFMNWRGNQAGEGYEYFLLAIGLALTIAASGGGSFSIDRMIARARS